MTSDTASSSGTTSSVAALGALEHKVEVALESALHAAERSLARRLGDRFVRALHATGRALLIGLVVVYFAFGALWLATRYWLLPRIDQYRPWLEQQVGRLIEARVQIARIDSDWRGFHPHLRLRNVQIIDDAGRALLTLPQLEATPSWFSLLALQVQFRDLLVLTPELDIERDAAGRFVIAGFVLDPAANSSDGALSNWVLSQRHIGIRDARVRYSDRTAGITHEFEDVDFEFVRGLITNQFALSARPPATLAGPIDVRGRYQRPWFGRASDLSQWTGHIFFQTDFADLAQLAHLTRVLPAAMTIESAQGALRAWLDFDQSRIERFTADLALAEVAAQLGTDLTPLHVNRLRGRVAQREWGNVWEGGQDFSVQGLELVGAEMTLAPTDARVRVTRAADDKPQRGLVEASGMSLATLTALADHLPLAPGWRELVARYGLRGDLSNLRYTWVGEAQQPTQYALRTRFAALAMKSQQPDPPFTESGKPRPGLPGFENLAGTLELDQRGGAVEVRAANVVLEFPGVFEEPRVAFDSVSADARWKAAEGFELQVASLAAANAHLELTAQAGYRRGGRGPGLIDAKGEVKRADAEQIHRYLPLVLGPRTRAWTQHALLGGQARDGSFKLKGDLADFPFAQPNSGEFRIAAKFAGGTLDYTPRRNDDGGPTPPAKPWPVVTDIDGEFLLERKRMEITGRSAKIFSTPLSGLRASIADFTAPDARLAIEGKSSGPLADQVRFVNESPVGGALNGLLARTTATGNATLDLRLDIPVHRPRNTPVDISVRGTVNFANNDVELRDDLPPFARLGGQLLFTERTVRLAGLNGNFAGGSFRAEVATRSDGAIEIDGSGTATPQGARRLLEPALPARMIERAQGTAKYSANLVLKGRRSDIRVDADLAGVALDLPEPLQKSAAEPLPLRVAITPLDDAGAADTLRVNAGARLAVLFERRRDNTGVARIERGAINIGDTDAAALALPDSGVRATVTAPRLNVDRWQALLEGPAEGAAALNVVAARVGELTLGGKSIANVVLGASRVDGNWVANVVSDHATGAVTWTPGQARSPGRVSARLARLSIPEQQRNELTELLDAPASDFPALDVRVDDFRLAGRSLGRLELLALSTAGGGGPWQLNKLELVTPDGRMQASGNWERQRDAGGRRRMVLALALEFSDGGALLARMGMPGVLRGGEGKLEGELTWHGSPLTIDYPTLAGSLKLGTAKGQFMKADAGAGRLLGVLSLQSLPRRMTLDFRDVFSEGFAFDAINATASIAAGVLTTNDFKMRGVNATVLIEGSADLKRETQNLHVLVLPEINAGSASLVYALIANPAIGLGTFLAQLLLRDPLSKAFSYEYDVTGSWADPQVTRRAREAAELTGTSTR